ncbi:MAG TPA: DUF3368 domain-containing protein [Armatimonadota bacterium]|jgi:predicted nucleic acid-binding protein
MTAVSDTTCINYLALIGELETLPRLFGQVVIPSAVLQELRHPRSPPVVAQCVAKPPSWLSSRRLVAPVDSSLLYLERGEREAIALAEELRADWLILDEDAGRREALGRNLPVTGTVGVLVAAADRDLVDLPQAVARLRQTSFRIRGSILDSALRRDAERRKQADR